MDIFPFLLFFIFVFLLAFFSGTEFPLMQMSRHKLDAFLKQKRVGARSLRELKKKNERLLIVNLIGTVIFTSLAAKFADDIAIEMKGHISLEGNPIAPFIVWGLFSLGTAVILLLGEITPKILGVRYADTIALLVAPIFRGIVFIISPLAWVVELFVKLLSFFFGSVDMHGAKVTQEELGAFIDMSHEGGAVEEDERRQIKNLLSLGDMTAESVMTPRVHMEFVELDMTVDQVCEVLMSSSHSRLPICGETTDDVEFVITFREAFKLQREGHGNAVLSTLNLEKIMRVPVTQPLDDLFEKFQKSRRHIALVLDEHGGTAGIVTMEDVLEEVFGDIKDEKDREEIYMKKRQDGKIEAVGTVLIDDILEEYNLAPDDIELLSDYLGEPLSYVIMAEKEEFPVVGAEVIFSGPTAKLILRVIQTDDNVIGKVECEKR